MSERCSGSLGNDFGKFGKLSPSFSRCSCSLWKVWKIEFFTKVSCGYLGPVAIFQAVYVIRIFIKTQHCKTCLPRSIFEHETFQIILVIMLIYLILSVTPNNAISIHFHWLFIMIITCPTSPPAQRIWLLVSTFPRFCEHMSLYLSC